MLLTYAPQGAHTAANRRGTRGGLRCLVVGALAIAFALVVTSRAWASPVERYCECWAQNCSQDPGIVKSQCIADWRQVISDCRTLNEILRRLGRPTIGCNPSFKKRLRRCRKGICGAGY